jgi:transcriptional regulator with XRE-family HTH domain
MRRKKLGAELRRLRVEAQISAEQVAELLDCSPSRVGHIETGRNTLRKAELKALLDLYDSAPQIHPVLEDLRKEGAQRGWWSTYRLPAWLQTYVGMEAEATRLRVFEIELITALLQTKEYARRVQETGDHAASPDDVNRFVDARMRRQTVLAGPDTPQLSAIISESALTRTAYEPSVGAPQLRHLLAAATRESVELRILPYSAGVHPAMSGSFHILDFDPAVSLPVAYQEHAVGGHLIDDQDVVATLSMFFDRLGRLTLDTQESSALVARYATEAEERDNGESEHQQVVHE